MTSLPFSTPRKGMHSQNQCSTSCLKYQFTPPAFCQFIIHMGCYNHIYLLGNNGHTRCLHPHMGWNLYHLHGYMHVSCILPWLACMYMIFKAIFIINTHTKHTDSYSCVRMHVYIHFVFKELMKSVAMKQIRIKGCSILCPTLQCNETAVMVATMSSLSLCNTPKVFGIQYMLLQYLL